MENWNEIQKTIHNGELNNPARSKDRRLTISPVTIRTARAFTAWTHRHLVPPVDAEFVIGVQSTGGALVGVAFVDRPICRAFDDDRTAEVTCLSTDGTPNACSALLGAAWRASRAKGYRRLIAYTRADEPGTSLCAAGFHRVADPAVGRRIDRRVRPVGDHGPWGTLMSAIREPYWSDEHAAIYQGDARQVLAEMDDGSVDCIVTSPPYWGLRHYCEGQYGQEPTPEEYVDTLRATFAEARRVLADDGTCWLNLGDCYAANSDGWARGTTYNRRQPEKRPKARLAVPPKNLLGMPWRVAFALQQDGWILRNAIIWHKPNAMPQSVRDRLSNRYELIFLLVKQRTYRFDLDPIREPYTGDRPITRRARSGGTKPNSITTAWPPPGKYGMAGNGAAGHRHGTAMRPTGEQHTACHTSGRNPGDVWPIPTRPLRAAHFAAFPIDIPLRAIAAGCRPGGKVLDPFMGSGTVGIAARQLGRTFSGIELNAAYCDLARTRLTEAGGPGCLNSHKGPAQGLPNPVRRRTLQGLRIGRRSRRAEVPYGWSCPAKIHRCLLQQHGCSCGSF